jgi:hypothetical protein
MADYPISNVPRRVQYVNSGVGPYAFAFEVLTQTDIAVYRGSTKLVLTTDYTVTINANGTGSVTLVAAGTGNITIVGARAIQRSSDYTTGGDLFASTLNTDLDSQTIFSQQLAEDVDLSIKVPVYAPSATGLTVNPEANKILGWDSTGANLINIDASTLASIAVYATAYADVFVSNGATVAYTLTRNPGSIYNLDISTDGVTQEPIRDYLLSGSVVTFTSAMPLNSRIVIKYKEGLPNVTADSQDIRYLPASSSTIRNVQAKLRETVSILDFGGVGDGATDNTAAMQAAHNTGKVVYYPAGEYRFSNTINVALGGILGSGLGTTFLVSTNTSNSNLFNYTGTTAGYFSGFQIQAPLAKTAGAAFEVVTATNDNAYSVFENVNFNQLPVGISFTKARLFKIIGCNFISYTVAGCLVANTDNNDAGDSVISNSTFYGGSPTAHGIVQYSSGGLKIIGNKFNDGATAYFLNYTVTSATSILIIDGNSIENMVSAAISLQSSVASSFTFNFVAISNNEIAICANGITTDTTGFISEMSVTGNVINVSASGAAIALVKVNNFTIGENTFNGPGGTVGINLDTCTNGKIGSNSYATATPYAIFTSTVAVQKDEQTGSVTTGLATLGLGALYNSAATTVTFPTPFKIAPTKADIQLIADSGTGAIGGIVSSTSTTNFVFNAISTNNSVAPIINWKAFGTL